jgi:rSAM/selenodomain-associated transferase 1
MNTKDGVLFYVKFPEYGKVKTRLANDIGHDHALDLYKCFLLDMLTMLESAVLCSDNMQICICYAPETAEPAFRALFGENYHYFPQQGNDLGERMQQSFQHAFHSGLDRAVLIGSDLPDLPVRIVTTAFERLNRFDIVIGPSGDGGYYLLGFRQKTFFPEVFQGITWSTAMVCAETLKKIEQAGYSVSLLPEWKDIDHYTDLQRFYVRNQHQPEQATNTMAYLRRIQPDICIHDRIA